MAVNARLSSGGSLVRPIIIGHRGACGYLPEHTLASYQKAIDLGADFIEPDLVLTQDGILIARHEPNLMATTNVQEIEKFSHRRTIKSIDGTAQEGFFAENFTLSEIKELRARQAHPYRDQQYNDRFEIPTLTEMIELVNRVEQTTGKRIGIYPETKHPTYFQQMGRSLEELLIKTLIAHDFTDPQRLFIQSFEVSNLKETLVPLMAQQGIQLPLIQLYDEFHRQPYDFEVSGDPRTYGDLIQPHHLQQFVSTYARGIGPWKRSVVPAEPIAPSSRPPSRPPSRPSRCPPSRPSRCPSGADQSQERLTGQILPIVQDAHAAGLLVHPYTFRNEERFLAIEYQGDAIAEYQQFFHLGVDGVFSDFPDTAVRARAIGGWGHE